MKPRHTLIDWIKFGTFLLPLFLFAISNLSHKSLSHCCQILLTTLAISLFLLITLLSSLTPILITVASNDLQIAVYSPCLSSSTPSAPKILPSPSTQRGNLINLLLWFFLQNLPKIAFRIFSCRSFLPLLKISLFSSTSSGLILTNSVRRSSISPFLIMKIWSIKLP